MNKYVKILFKIDSGKNKKIILDLKSAVHFSKFPALIVILKCINETNVVIKTSRIRHFHAKLFKKFLSSLINLNDLKSQFIF